MALIRRPTWSVTLPLGGPLLLGILLTYLLLALAGHDPWRSDDAIHLGIAQGFQGSQWLIPKLAGEPWLRSPPLFHWLAAMHGKLFGALLPWHDAARLASATALGVGFFGLYRAAEKLASRDAAAMAPLLAVGTLGLLAPAQEAQPALLGFAAMALALMALARWRDKPLAAGALLGAAFGVGFLGDGLSIAVPLAGMTLLLFAHPHWRSGGARSWWLAIAVATLLAGAWPLALWQAEPGLARLWWEEELASLGGDALGGKRLELLAWAAWPVLPLALWGLWLERRRLTQPANFMMLSALAASFVFFLRSREAASALMPLLAALCLIAATAAARLRRGAANAFDWFGAICLSLFMLLIWLGGIAILTGSPERIAKNFSKPAPGFVAEWSWLALAFALAVTLAWIYLLVSCPRSPWRAATRWSLGVAILWSLIVSLWLPWIDYGKSYRSVALELRRTLGKSPGCIERRGVGPAQRASLDYFAGIRTRTAAHAHGCAHLLVQARPGSAKEIAGWALLKETARPGDRSETLRLYRREE